MSQAVLAVVLFLTLNSSTHAATLNNWAPGGFGNGGPVSEASITAQYLTKSDLSGLLIADYAAKQVRYVLWLNNSIWGDQRIQLLASIQDPPLSVATTPDGRYFLGTNKKILEVVAPNTVTVRYENPTLYPTGMTWHDGNLYVANADSSKNQVVKFPLDTFVPEVVVNQSGAWNSTGDNGPALQATLRRPGDVVFDGEDLFISERDGGKVRRVRNSIITTVAGSGATLGDGGLATQARLLRPASIRVKDGELYIADSGQHRVRKVNQQGIITTIAGTGNDRFPQFNSDPLLADLPSPESLEFDSQGNLYIGLPGTKKIYILSPDMQLATPTATTTPSVVTATVTLTATAVPTETSEMTVTIPPSPTGTFTPSFSPTFTPTATVIPTSTPTYTQVATPTTVPYMKLICDVTGNGRITALDAAYVLQYVVGLRNFTEEEKLLADATENGSVSALDATAILQFSAGITNGIENRCGAALFF